MCDLSVQKKGLGRDQFRRLPGLFQEPRQLLEFGTSQVAEEFLVQITDRLVHVVQKLLSRGGEFDVNHAPVFRAAAPAR